jgi:hypothetical protein
MLQYSDHHLCSQDVSPFSLGIRVLYHTSSSTLSVELLSVSQDIFVCPLTYSKGEVSKPGTVSWSMAMLQVTDIVSELIMVTIPS